MNCKHCIDLHLTRRQFFGRSAQGIGIGALATLLGPDLNAARGRTRSGARSEDRRTGRAASLRAEGEAGHLPASVRRTIAARDVRLQARCWRSSRARRSRIRFARGSASRRRWGSRSCWSRNRRSSSRSTASRARGSASCLPHTAKIVDDITVIKTMNTEAINHDPAITFIQTGFQQPGRPSMGAWLSYGLGSENQNLPAFVVLLSQAHAINTDQPLFSRLWASGFLPSSYQGVRFRAGSAPVLFLEDPPGISKTTRQADARRRREARRDRASRLTAIQKSKRGSVSTRWRIGCRPRCRI